MTPSLGRDALIYSVSNLLVRGIQIVLIPLYTRVLGAGEYGMVETVAIVGALVNLTVALEVSQGMARALADTDDTAERRRIASTALAFTVLAYGLFVVAAAATAPWAAARLLGPEGGPGLVVLAAAALAANGVFALLQDLSRWLLRPWAYLAAGLVYTGTTATTGIALVWGLGIGVSGVFQAQIAAAVAGAVVAATLGRRLLAPLLDMDRLRRMLAFSLPLVLSGLAVFGNLFVDRLAVRQVLGLEALGVYGVAARFASVVGIVTVGLQAALTPLVYRTWREPGAAARLGRLFRLYVAAMTAVVGGLSLFSGEILALLTGPAYQDGRWLLPTLATASLLASLYVFTPGLFLGQRTGRVAAVNVAGAALNLALSLLLVPALGLIGAALSSVTAAAAVFAGYARLGRATFDVPLGGWRTAVTGACLAVVVAGGTLWNLPPPTLAPLAVAAKLVMLLGIVLVLVLALDKRDRRGITTDI